MLEVRPFKCSSNRGPSVYTFELLRAVSSSIQIFRSMGLLTRWSYWDESVHVLSWTRTTGGRKCKKKCKKLEL